PMFQDKAMQTMGLLLKAYREFRRDRRGAALVEFAVVSTMLIALMLPLSDLGMGFYVKTQVMTAAEAGAQYAFHKGWSTDNQTAQTAICSAVINASGLGNS